MKAKKFWLTNHKGTTAWCQNLVHFIVVILLSSLSSKMIRACKDEAGFIIKQDHAFVGHVIETLMTNGLIECLMRCMEHINCLSANYAGFRDGDVMSQCELNSDKGGSPCLIFRAGTSYYELLKEKIGSYSPCYNNGIFVQESCKSFCKCTSPYSGKYCEDFYPMNCKHIQESGIKQDGEYNLFVMWPNDKRSGKVYCADMASKTPLEYVTLPAGKGNNFARYYQKQTHEKQETMFTKIRLNLAEMKIVTNDYRFATTNVPGVYHRYASAGDCKSHGCTNPRSGIFQVDISGTSFRLQLTIPYKYFTYPACAQKLFSPTMDASRLRWSATCGGRCGSCTPEYLHLELSG